MSVLFTSDPHFGHRKVAALRGFGTEEEPDTEAHDEALAASWHGIVGRNDVVWILGDLAASAPDYALARIAALPGRKRLIAGNHDRIHPMNREAWKWSRRYAEVFEFVAPFARTKVLGREVVLSHFPYTRDRHEARYMQWRLRDEGLPLLHGHTHGTERLTVTQRAEGPRVEVHVGVDAWHLSPVTDESVAMLLDRGTDLTTL